MAFKAFFGVLTLASSLALPAFAQDYKVGALLIHDPWARATPHGAPVGGGYAVIENTGDSPDRLTAASVSVASQVSVHQMAMKDGVMVMGPLEGGLDIPAHGKVTLSPGAFHLMFTGLKQQLKKGDSVPGTLVFEKAGAVDVLFKVEAIGARQASGNTSHDGH